MSRAAYNREVGKALKELSVHVHDVLPDGTQQSKAEALADLLWKYALGWVETTTDDEGNRTDTRHDPKSWAMQYVMERLEGRTPQALTENENRVKAADKVHELAKSRLNNMAQRANERVGPVAKSGPPTYKKGPESGE